MNFNIRIIGPDDARLLSTLATRAFCETFGSLYPEVDLAVFLQRNYHPDVLAAELDRFDQLWLLAETDAGPAGYMQVAPAGLPHPELEKSHGEIKRLYVLAEHQGRGMAAALMTQGLTFLETNFAGPIWLGVWSENLRAQRFYARYGFEKVGEYAFPVGRVRDLEWIFRRPAADARA